MKKKHLGQHFLHNTNIIQRVVDSSGGVKGEIVVEVGPGDGALTAPLLAAGFRVIAVEYDKDLTETLEVRFATEISSGQLQIIYGDILTLEPGVLLNGVFGYRVVANIPYYITGAIIQYFLGLSIQPRSMSLVMQREVADRIVAQDGKHSLLSLSVYLYGTPQKVMNISAGSFTPPPQVDSALLVVKNIRRDHLPLDFSVANFFALLHAGFGQKRKQLKTNIKGAVSEQRFAEWIETYNLPMEVRAEDVPLSAWVELAPHYKNTL